MSRFIFATFKQYYKLQYYKMNHLNTNEMTKLHTDITKMNTHLAKETCVTGTADKLGTVNESTHLLPPNQHHLGTRHDALLPRALQQNQQTSGLLL